MRLQNAFGPCPRDVVAQKTVRRNFAAIAAGQNLLHVRRAQMNALSRGTEIGIAQRAGGHEFFAIIWFNWIKRVGRQRVFHLVIAFQIG